MASHGHGEGETKTIKCTQVRGLPWRSSAWDSVLPMQGAQVRSLVGELGSPMLHGVAKKKPCKSGWKRSWGIEEHRGKEHRGRSTAEGA